MYFPYLRGRQFELIALREMLNADVLSDKIIPIIEPVKLSPTLIRTLEAYVAEKRKVAFVVNPKVGSFLSDLKEKKNAKLKESLGNMLKENENILGTVILKKDMDSNMEAIFQKFHGRILTICDNKDAIPSFDKWFGSENTMYNLIPDETSFRRKIRKNKVMLDDKFNKQLRNNDYIKIDDEPFSEDHLFYAEEGYDGFSDYSVVGKEYSDTGFAPYAVAIHIVYFDDDGSLRVRHFVSDSNEDISDPAGKFQEALDKLVLWNKEKKIETSAMKEFQELHDKEAYPGLGTVKKLSIMHHLELMGMFLDKE